MIEAGRVQGQPRRVATSYEWRSLRLLLPLALLVLVALSRFYTYQTAIAQEREEILADLQRNLALLGARLQPEIESALREHGLADVQRHLSALGSTPEIKTALLADEDGRVIAAANSAAIGKDARSLEPDAFSTGGANGRTWVSNERNLVLAVYPVALNLGSRGGDHPVARRGVMFMAADPSPLLAEHEARIRAWMGKTNWVVAVVALLVWLLVHLLVSRRVGKLVNTVEAFGAQLNSTSAGELYCGVSGKDEIGRLGEAFDRMMRTQKSCSLKARTLSQAVEQSAASVIISDRNGTIEYVNPAFTAITGYTQQEAIGRNPGMLSAGETTPEKYGELWSVITAGNTWRGEMLNRRKNGELYWDLVVISPISGDDGEITHFVAVQDDITERKKAEQELLLSAHILNSISEGVAVTDADQKFRYVNPAFTAITGYSPDEVIGKSPKLLSSGLMEKTFYGSMWRNITESNHWQGEIIDRRKNGESFAEWLSISTLKDETGKISRYVSVFTDISERKAAELRMVHMAQHDFLTGLPNRMLLLDRLDQAIARAERDGRKVGVMFLDLDRFKNINDTLGHTIGDKLLQDVATRLSQVSRAGDTICRLGGDEFVVMLPGVGSAEDISVIAGKLLESVAEPCVIDGHEIEVTASIGISIFPEDGRQGDVLLQHADSAMYHAKEGGRGGYRFFTSEMNERVLQRLLIEKNLRRGLARNEFVLHYQPQIDLRSGELVGAEALVRWNRPETGLVPPGEFIHVAEENGVIIQLGEWVLREACRQKAQWLRLGLPELVMSVNLSAVQFRHKHLGDIVMASLRENGLDPSGLELEITESAVMTDAEGAISLLNQLKKMGVKLAMDDFGTGYSSLSHLKRLPIDKLKIDQSFVRDVPHDRDDKAIVSTIIGMAQHLGLKVVAEGVETEGQLAFLHQNGCDEGQGFYFGSPMPAHEFMAHVKQRLQS
jgi:diguanylate cyclase (GGDEF)-like protein/PAS domain S-box-containing protein